MGVCHKRHLTFPLLRNGPLPLPRFAAERGGLIPRSRQALWARDNEHAIFYGMKLVIGLAVIGIVLIAFLRLFWNPPSRQPEGTNDSRHFGKWPEDK